MAKSESRLPVDTGRVNLLRSLRGGALVGLDDLRAIAKTWAERGYRLDAALLLGFLGITQAGKSKPLALRPQALWSLLTCVDCPQKAESSVQQKMQLRVKLLRAWVKVAAGATPGAGEIGVILRAEDLIQKRVNGVVCRDEWSDWALESACAGETRGSILGGWGVALVAESAARRRGRERDLAAVLATRLDTNPAEAGANTQRKLLRRLMATAIEGESV